MWGRRENHLTQHSSLVESTKPPKYHVNVPLFMTSEQYVKQLNICVSYSVIFVPPCFTSVNIEFDTLLSLGLIAGHNMRDQ